MKSDSAIVSQFYGKKGGEAGHKAISESMFKKQKQEDDKNWEFYHGDRAAYTHEMSYDNQKLAVCFNRVRPYIHSFIGFAAQNRRQPEYFALERDDQLRVAYTETANRMLSAIRSTANADQVETEQDKWLAVCGYGAVIAVENYETNPDGQVDYIECSKDYWWDPYAFQPGLVDRRWGFIKKKMSGKDAVMRFGGNEEDYQATETTEFTNFEYHNNAPYDRISYDWVGASEKGQVYIYEYHWYEMEKYWRIKNPAYDPQYQAIAPIILQRLEAMRQIRLEEEESEDLFKFDPKARIFALTKDQYDDVTAIFESIGIEVDADENLRKLYCEAVLSGNKVFKKRKSIDQSGFACKIKTADYDRKNNLWHGMVSSLREPAKYANKSLTEFLLILAGTAKPGFFYDIDRVGDVAVFEKNALKNKKALGVNGNPNEVIMSKQQAVLPSGYDALYPVFVKALSDAIGFAPEALGMGDLSQPSAEIEQQRIKQVMTTLAIYFDSITLYQRDRARSDLYFMRRLARNNEGRPIPVTDGEGEKRISEVYSNMIADEYTIDIGEIPDTPTMRKEQGNIMRAYAAEVAQLVPPKAAEVYALAATYLPISQSEQAKWRNLLTPPQDPQAVQAAQEDAAKQKQIQEQTAIGQIEWQAAEAALKKAQAEKALAEVQKVQAETNKTDIENIAATTVSPENISLTI